MFFRVGIVFSVLMSPAMAAQEWENKGSGGPGTRAAHAFVWNAQAGKLLLFGGNTSPETIAGDLWSWDPATETWIALTPPSGGTVPSARTFVQGVWDSSENRMIIFGGVNSYFTLLNETWAYTPSTNLWAQITTSGASPSPRDGHAMIYDAATDRMIVFGGWAGGETGSAEVWALNLAGPSATWEPRAPLPIPLAFHTAVLDPSGGKVYIYGGTSDLSVWLSTTYTYNIGANSWEPLTATGGYGRAFHASAWDTQNGIMLSYGGLAGEAFYSDFWAFAPASGTWAQLAGGPGARASAGAAWDPVNHRFYLHGGMDSFGTMSPGELWVSQIPEGFNPGGTVGGSGPGGKSRERPNGDLSINDALCGVSGMHAAMSVWMGISLLGLIGIGAVLARRK